MQEQRYDGEMKLTDNVAYNDEKHIAALKDLDNKMVALHRAGSVVTASDGTKYEVAENGSWKKISG